LPIEPFFFSAVIMTFNQLFMHLDTLLSVFISILFIWTPAVPVVVASMPWVMLRDAM
jgi:hypothetical protein